MAGTPISLTPLQARVDGFVGTFTQTVLDWKTLAAFTGGGLAGRAGKLAVSPGSLLGKAASLTAGLSAETLTFELTHRSLQNDARLWRWNGIQGMKAGLFHSALTFGSLKGAGGIARGENLVVQHLLQDTALVGAHQLSHRLGLASKPQGSLADQFLQAEATTLQVGAALTLGHSLVPALGTAERLMDSTLQMREGNSRSHPFIFGRSSPAFAGASGGPQSSKALSDTTVYQIGGRGEPSYPGLKAPPTVFKNGEIFTANRNRIPDGLPIVYVPPSKSEMKAEDAICQTISAHLGTFKRRGKPEPFLVVYGERTPLDPKELREKMQGLIGTSLGNNFLVVVANPHGSAPGAILYRRKGDKLEIDSWTTIRTNLPEAPKEPSSPPWKGASATASSPRIESPGAADPRAASPARPRKKEVETRTEFIPRTQGVETVSDAAEGFGHLLKSLGEGKQSPGSWFIEISKPFIEMSAKDLDTLSLGAAALMEPGLKSARATIQDSILRQIQNELIDRLIPLLRKYPIPEGHIVTLKWKEPGAAYLRIQEEKEKDLLHISISGNLVPPRHQAFKRSEIGRGVMLDLAPRGPDLYREPSLILESPAVEISTSPAPEREPSRSSINPYDHLTGFLDPRKKADDLNPIRFDCDQPGDIIRHLDALLASQRGTSLPARPIQIGVSLGKLDREFLTELLNFLRENPPLNGQEIQIAWAAPNSRLTAKYQDGEILGEIQEPLGGGLVTYSVTLKADGTKTDGTRFQSGRREQ